MIGKPPSWSDLALTYPLIGVGRFVKRRINVPEFIIGDHLLDEAFLNGQWLILYTGI